MAWDIPTPTEIADQASTDMEDGLRLDADGAERTIDARSNRSVLRVLAVVMGLALYPVYLFFTWVLDQLFPDRCSETWLAVHARLWGIDRVAATRATGTVTLTGTEGTAIAAGTRMSLSGSRWQTTTAATVGSGGSVSAAVEAVTAGSGGNRAAGAELSLETAIVGLTSQVATVGTGGLTGGSDLEDVETWRGRVVARIRQPPHGGADFDYATWATDWGAARVAVHRSWIGAGTVGVVFAMTDAYGALRVPTTDEVAALQAEIDEKRPVTATVIVLACMLKTVDVTVEVSPWSTAVETAVKAAAAAYFASSKVQIATDLHVSQLRERLSRAAGEDWHILTAPTGDIVSVGSLELPVAGTVTVTEADT